jgi:uncharacterized protein YqhQ
MTPLKMPTYGGQAVIEGVMMRGSHTIAIAMRAPDKQIVIHKEPLGNLYRSKIIKLPFVRGLIMLWDALGLGMRALTISANIQTGEDQKLEGPLLYITLGISLVFAIGLFFLTPFAVGQLMNYLAGGETWMSLLIEGIIRLIFLIGYIWIIGHIPDISRVFAYHGAEHKTINAFEAGIKLSPEEVKKCSLEHPRCGTSFLLTLVVFSILLFSFLGPLPFIMKLVGRIVLIPVLASLAYEYIRWTANHLHWKAVQVIVKPNLALQHLTTREPTTDMLEVSIAAFNAMRQEEEHLVT